MPAKDSGDPMSTNWLKGVDFTHGDLGSEERAES